MEDNVVDIEDTSPTDVLPPEIISHIFTFLPLADRKCVRLTCRSWYDCCTSVNITKHEKFVFRTDPGVEHIRAVSNYSLINLEFPRLAVRMVPATVWKVCGPRIRELEFHMCQWDDETISNIILHCENLTSLVITHNDVYDDEKIGIAYSPRLLDDFIKKGIRRPKLHTLSISIEPENIEPDEHCVLRKIFQLHPGIKHLTFTLISHNLDALDLLAMSLDKCLNPDTGLESLTSMILTPGVSMKTLVDKNGQECRLKFLAARLVHDEIDPTQENKILNFFRTQKNLEVIKLWTSFNSDNLFYIILESCPKLREFRFLSTRWDMDLRPPEVSRFIACISKLKLLELAFGLEDSEQVPSIFNLLPRFQLDLTSLIWWYPSGGSSAFRATFLQRCSSLKHLRLERSCDTTLQIIFKHLPELKTLVLDDIFFCTAFGFSGRTDDGNEAGYSIKRLQQLKHLELIRCESDLTERITLELQLPRLEFLSLSARRYRQLSKEDLNHFASHLPQLRVLAIDDVMEGDRMEETIQLCKQFNKLHRLIMTSMHLYRPLTNWVKQFGESIFSACPSLWYISDYAGYTCMRDLFPGNLMVYKGYMTFSSGNFFT